jgi:hypothetical protein
LALFANLHEHRDATLEFYMCMVWGMSPSHLCNLGGIEESDRQPA